MVKIKDVMKKHVITTDVKTDISTIAKIMTNNKIGSVVITKDDEPVNIVTTEDIVGIVARDLNPKKVTAGDIINEKKKDFIYADPENNLLDVVRMMIKSGVKRIPVIDKEKNLVGIVSDKEILTVSPELIEILSEKLKSRIEATAKPDEKISGICEECGCYSDELTHFNGRWLCPDCLEKMETT